MDSVCLLFLATLVQFGVGVDMVLHSHARACLRVVTGLLNSRTGALDLQSAAKASGLVGVLFRGSTASYELSPGLQIAIGRL